MSCWASGADAEVAQAEYVSKERMSFFRAEAQSELGYPDHHHDQVCVQCGGSAVRWARVVSAQALVRRPARTGATCRVLTSPCLCADCSHREPTLSTCQGAQLAVWLVGWAMESHACRLLQVSAPAQVIETQAAS